MLRNTLRFVKSAGRIPATLLSRLMPRDSLQVSLWVLVGMVGIGLGIYILLLPTMNTWKLVRDEFDISSRTWSLLLILAGLSPFVGIIAARIVTHLRRLLVMVILLEVPIQLDYRFGYSELEQRFGTVSGFTISVTTICLVILYGWWLVEILGKWRTPSGRSTLHLILPSVAYITVVVLSISFARSMSAAFNWSGLVLQAFLLYLYIIHYIQTPGDLYFIATMLAIGLILSSLAMIGYGLIGAGHDPLMVEKGYSNLSRVGGTLADPNLAGSYLSMALTFVFSLYAIRQKWWFGLLVTVSLGIGGVALLWTGSRGSWSSTALAVGLLGFFLLRKRWLPRKVPIFFSIVVIIIFVIFQEPILERLFSEESDQAALSRIPLIIISLRMIGDHFFIGVGANNFAYYLRDYVTSEMGGYWIRVVHNQYLLVWSENGIIGLVAYLWFLLTTLRYGWQAWRGGHERFLSVITLGAMASLFAGMFHMQGEKYHARIQVEMVFLVAGIVMAGYRIWVAEE